MKLTLCRRFALAFAATCVCFASIAPAQPPAPLKIDPILQAAEDARIAAIDRARPSAVSVYVPGGGGGGSGVLISPDGFALTNFHVSSPAGVYMRCSLADGNVYDAVLVGIDPVGDLAMIRLLGRDDFPFARLADSRRAQAGDWCMVIGNPFLLASNLQPTVTWGILSGVGRYQYPSGTLLEYADCLQTDASINPGNSGGPIYNDQGDLLGIVGRASFEKRGRVNVGVGYAISIHQAKNFLGYLRSGRVVDHATLGATVTTEENNGVSVSNILESSDAYRRGLRYGAEILEIDGRSVQTANDVQNVLGTLPSQWRVKMSFRDQGVRTDTLVRLRSVHRKDELLQKMSAALPPPPPREQEKKEEDEKEPGDGKLPNLEDLKKLKDKILQKPKKKKYPKEIEKQLVLREGYGNYHFNLAEQDHFIAALRGQFPGGKADVLPTWHIEGETTEATPRPVSIQIESGNMALKVGDEVFGYKTKADLYEAIDRETIAGILPVLDAWRRMSAQGPKKFGESYYLGTMPLLGERPLRDCMIATDGELEVRWLSHPKTHLVEAVEVFADRDRDPAELLVVRKSDEKGQQPIELKLLFGTQAKLSFTVSSWETKLNQSPNREDAS
ncbi:S1C family serine protease [Planctomycetes bacterium K23_9]|uniref:Serine protease HhoB n=1 Tax=Stieleria marina TaxID=1930275 RepID=A0A517NZC2_9BACT|nr:Putative serine protease HhoB precursor [Planctomycetes bacterium K23_9]